MAQALKAQDRATHQKRKSKKAVTDTLRSSLASKKFGDLSSPEKEDLLKLIAIQLGFIKSDND